MKELKLNYEEVSIVIIPLSESDVITSSGAFDGDDDMIWNW